MASKVAASAMGGSSFLTRAVGGLVSKQISWNNVETLTGLMKDIYRRCLVLFTVHIRCNIIKVLLVSMIVYLVESVYLGVHAHSLWIVQISNLKHC